MDKARGGLSALGALAPVTFAGAACLLPAAYLFPGNFWPHDWTALLLLALSSQVLGQGMLIYGLPHLAPVASGVGLLIQPALSALVGYLWFGELLAPLDIAGMTAIFAAIILVRWPSRARPAVEKRVPPSPAVSMPPRSPVDEAA
jgi:drug/metabolite transporter (DMT)-like permease